MSVTWSNIRDKLIGVPKDEQQSWLAERLDRALKKLSAERKDRNVIFYATAFLQQPNANTERLYIDQEDVNGFKNALCGMDCKKGLSLMLHVPGGDVNAAETIIAYLRSKFKEIESIIPLYAMSSGTMIALSTDQIVMGKQSQLGPIDPQIGDIGSAISILLQREMFQEEDGYYSSYDSQILELFGTALEESEKAIKYSQNLAKELLQKGMINDEAAAEKVAHILIYGYTKNEEKPARNHSRRIDSKELLEHGLKVESLEKSQVLQDIVLEAYHLATIIFEDFGIAKFVVNDKGQAWSKDFAPNT